jgi:RNA polymerase sigma-70 factor (ECF subfamily)
LNCDELRKRLTEHIDQSLASDLCREVERHLAECPECAEMEHDLHDLQRLCRECPPPRLPKALRERVEKMLQED